MALVHHTNKSDDELDPKTSLTKALQEFEGVLSADQKVIYRSNYAKPETQDVVALISRIDADNKGRSGRCFAPRLCTFLNSTVQFAGVVDTFVSSKPNIAALVWGSLKTVMVVSSNVASFFEKVTNMIMEIGRTCPTYQQFGQLYPSSKALQAALCEYFAIIVRLCTKILLISQRSGIAQIAMPIFSPFEAEFQKHRGDLASAEREIQCQISLASKQVSLEMAKVAELESKQNRIHRDLMRRFRNNTSDELSELRRRLQARELLQIKTDILTNMSTIDHMNYWKEVKSKLLPGTADWFETDPSFLQWKNENQNSVLWCSGTLGVGKSVLVSNIVSHLMANRQPEDVVLYHFCQFDRPDSLLAKNLIGGLCRQVFTGQLEGMAACELRERYNQSQDGDILTLWQLLSHATKGTSATHLIIDGLDECESDEIRTTVEMVSRLYKLQHNRFKILYATRPELELTIRGGDQVDHRICLVGKHVDKDIHQYIETMLDKCLQNGRLKLGNPTLITNIVVALAEGSKGMFLWTKLLIDEICDEESDHDILEALKKLPRDLTELFRRKIERIKSGSQARNAIKALRYCGLARRPLSVAELQEALSVDVGEQQWDRRRIPNDGVRIVEGCHGLVSINEEDCTIRYAHHSVRHYLFHDSMLSEFAYEPQDLQFDLLCLTYLSFPDFERQVGEYARTSYSSLVPLHIGISALSEDSSKGSAFARGILKRISQSRSLSATNLSDNVQNFTDHERSDPGTASSKGQFHLLRYAEVYSIYHLRDLSKEAHPAYWPSFLALILKLTFTSPPWQNLSSPAMYSWALQDDHGALLEHLLRDRASWPDFTDVVLGVILSGKQRMWRTLNSLQDHITLRRFDTDEINRVLALSGSPQYLEITRAIMRGIRHDYRSHVEYIRAAIATALIDARADVLYELLLGYAPQPDWFSVEMQSICLFLAILEGRSDIVQLLAMNDKTLQAPDGLTLPTTSGLRSITKWVPHDASNSEYYVLSPGESVTCFPRLGIGVRVFLTIPMVVAVLLDEMKILQLLIAATEDDKTKDYHMQMALEAAHIVGNREACKFLLDMPTDTWSGKPRRDPFAFLGDGCSSLMGDTGVITHEVTRQKEEQMSVPDKGHSEELAHYSILHNARENARALLQTDHHTTASLLYISIEPQRFRETILQVHWKELVLKEVRKVRQI